MNVVDEIFRIFDSPEARATYGDGISMRAHALQTALLAEREHAPDHLVVAALLHDIGHLLEGPEGGHEVTGSAWLHRHFGTLVAEPVRLHVDAKRYLCALSPHYLLRLTPESKRSLASQGGPMTEEENAAFHAERHGPDALRLRWWDDLARIPDLEVGDLEAYRERIERVLGASPAPTAAACPGSPRRRFRPRISTSR
jgi:gamma-butyrobetaine dioxygenase